MSILIIITLTGVSLFVWHFDFLSLCLKRNLYPQRSRQYHYWAAEIASGRGGVNSCVNEFELQQPFILMQIILQCGNLCPVVKSLFL
jgi:hypothetical protein